MTEVVHVSYFNAFVKHHSMFEVICTCTERDLYLFTRLIYGIMQSLLSYIFIVCKTSHCRQSKILISTLLNLYPGCPGYPGHHGSRDGRVGKIFALSIERPDPTGAKTFQVSKSNLLSPLNSGCIIIQVPCTARSLLLFTNVVLLRNL